MPFIILFIILLCLTYPSQLEKEKNDRIVKEQQEQIIVSENHKLYDAWCKSTGNNKNLTFEEFITLKQNNLLK